MNQARIIGTGTAASGLLADNGVGVTLVNSTLTGNSVKDIQLTFGTRADFRTLTFGSYHVRCHGARQRNERHRLPALTVSRGAVPRA